MDGNFNYYNFSASILKWYISERRDLPWRNTTDPYKIWLSEIILQQTRVNQGLPYYLKFLEEYPTVYKLAEADLSTVLRAWQGLGYYSRVRNLHKCAITICEEYGGKFPSEYDELIKLPGIGSYTASAIASFAFKRMEAVVDGNVFRVLSRYFGIEEDISSSKGQKYFHEFALKILPEKQTDQYNQGLMEFGALQCKPASPACDVCPIAIGCFARERNFIEKFPVKTGKTKIKKVVFNYVVFVLNQKVYMQKREVGIWQGLYEFFLVEGKPVLIDAEISKSF
ncbi:MAG: A/G-specific adenine glycosylase, partial [Cyclobacteriaceae bacterium]|nr:A/G-specific adenine glycosylase [Cyclobacteriaceae bacterium]